MSAIPAKTSAEARKSMAVPLLVPAAFDRAGDDGAGDERREHAAGRAGDRLVPPADRPADAEPGRTGDPGDHEDERPPRREQPAEQQPDRDSEAEREADSIDLPHPEEECRRAFCVRV